MNTRALAYNLEVPTPFYHISLAYELLEHSEVDPNIKDLLNNHSSGFMFGNTAPDVQVISGATREDTHFFTIPPEGRVPAWQHMLAAHPGFVNDGQLTPDKAAFLAGYICHLQADEKWIIELFLPIFGPDAGWADFRQRLYLHNVLRAYMDQQVIATMPAEAGAQLQASNPNNWLPFVEDRHLLEWQSYLAVQLRPGEDVKTAEVFAERLGLQIEEFTDMLNSESRMDKEIFIHLPRERIAEFRRTLVAENVQLINNYLETIQGN